jgi:hypothetical protein
LGNEKLPGVTQPVADSTDTTVSRARRDLARAIVFGLGIGFAWDRLIQYGVTAGCR